MYHKTVILTVTVVSISDILYFRNVNLDFLAETNSRQVYVCCEFSSVIGVDEFIVSVFTAGKTRMVVTGRFIIAV